MSGGFSDPDGDTLAYAAESGDTAAAAVTVDGSVVTIIARAAGSAAVTVTATDPGGRSRPRMSATQSFTVTVAAANEAPEVADTIPDQELTAGDTLTVDVSGGFSDPDGDTLAYAAESGDTAAAAVTVDGSVVTIIARAAGTAAVTVTATDPGGLSATQSFTVTVAAANEAPEVADTIPDQELTAGDTLTVDVSGGFSDPDGDTLAYAAESGDTAAAAVTVDGSVVTIIARAAGTAAVTVTATDPGGLSATQSFTVTVAAANEAPEVADTIPDQELTAGDTLTVDVSGGFSDPDGDTLAYAAESGDTAAAAVTVDGSVVTIIARAAGTAAVTVTATDPGGLSATQSFTVTVAAANEAPEVADTIPDQELTAGDTLTVDVSGGFSDPDGDTLAYAAESGDTAAAAVTVDGSVVTARAAGTAAVTVTATDPGGLSATQSFTVTVAAANEAPEVADTIPDQELTAGDTLTVDVSGGFSDPDGDTLAYAAESGDTAAAAVTVDGSVVTIIARAAGSAAVTVTATDPGGLSATQSFTVTVAAANEAPEVADTIPDQELTAGDTLTVDVSGGFSDPDGDTLAYAAESGDTAAAAVTVDGSVVTIIARAAGSAAVTVTATDPGGLSATQSFTVTVAAANEAPEVADTIPEELTAGDTDLPVHDLLIVLDTADMVDTLTMVVLDMADYFSDPEGDTLTYMASISDTSIAKVAMEGSVVTTTAQWRRTRRSRRLRRC